MKTVPHQSLDHLQNGSTASVLRVEGEDTLARRLRDLGFWPGTRIAVVRRGPFGGPVEYRLRGYRLALRPSEAARVVVASLAAG